MALLLTNRISHADHAFGEDLRAQASAMSQPFDHRTSNHRLQMLTGFTQSYPPHLHITEQKLASHQVIQWHITGHDIAASDNSTLYSRFRASIASASISVSSKSGSGL